MSGKQRHSLRVMSGKKDVYIDGKLYAEGLDGEVAYIDVPVAQYDKQLKVECRESGRPYSTKKKD